MVYQYVNNRPLHLGSMDVRVLAYGATGGYASAQSIGVLDGVTFTVSGTPNVVVNDNAEDIDLGLSDQQVEIGASAWKNLDLDVLNKIFGDIGSVTSTAATAQTVTGEQITLKTNTGVPFAHKNYDNTKITVTSAKLGDVSLVENTDYVLQLDVSGNTVIIPMGSTVEGGDVITVNYSYTPAASKTYKHNTSAIPKQLHAWLINTNADGKKFIIEVYKVSAITGAALSFGSDKAKALVSMPISMIGREDGTRPANDMLFNFVDEQGV